MIVRTYQRRNRGVGRSLTDSGLSLGDAGSIRDSCSQESIWSDSQDRLSYTFPSSQDSSSWSQADSGSGGLPTSFPIQASHVQGHGDFNSDALAASVRERCELPWSSRQEFNADTSKRKCDKRFSPGQKLRRAETSLTGLGSLHASKTSWSRSAGRGTSGVVGSALGTIRERLDPATSVKSASVWGPCAPPTSTLMEAQESGEMMEHVDEANFAMDGLRPGQPLRIRRASLVSLLSICGTMQRRRLLRTHGMAKPVLDAVLALPTDDPPTALAAAALLYVMAGDGQDEHLLDSSDCIQFLMKLLGPYRPSLEEKRVSYLGNKLLGLGSKHNSRKVGMSLAGIDHGGGFVVAKVNSLLSSLKGGGIGNVYGDDQSGYHLGEELSSQWLALLTLEKACLSTVVLEDNSGSVRRVGGHFKERLRELGGLDAVCELAASCFLNLREIIKTNLIATSTLHRSSMSLKGPRGVGMLLRCLKVMENVTFLSENNQRHLLEMSLSKEILDSPNTFVGVVVGTINTLSELILRQKNGEDVMSIQKRNRQLCSTVPDASSMKPASRLLQGFRDIKGSTDCNGKEEVRKVESSSRKGSTVSHKNSKHVKTVNVSGLKKMPECSQVLKNGSIQLTPSEFSSVERDCSELGSTEACKSLKGGGGGGITQASCFDRPQKVQISNSQEAKRSAESVQHKKRLSIHPKAMAGQQLMREDSQDPFEFDEADLSFGKESLKINALKKQKGKVVTKGELVDGSFGFEAAQDCMEGIGRGDIIVEPGKTKERLDAHLQEQLLLEDCLLSAVKVLMNLTNENDVGCCQVAACGGLDTMASLITGHYPSFQSLSVPGNKREQYDELKQVFTEGRNANQLDEDLDLLVVILGVLVNLVEKDTRNRGRLASLNVDGSHLATNSRNVHDSNSMIRLLCSIFLSKEGAGEAVETTGGKFVTEIDDDATFKQGQREAEDMILEAYAALLLAFLSKEGENVRTAIARHLLGDNLKALVPVLERFLAFHLSLNMMSAETHAAVRDVIESCKRPL